jgi:hypothetical protein
MVIKRIGPMSCARISGTLYAIMGILLGAIFSVAALAGAFTGDSSQGPFAAAFFGVAAILVLPVLYGGVGFVAMFIAAWLYNFLAELVGGIELDIQ